MSLDIRIDVFENDLHELEACAVEGKIHIVDYEETLYIPLGRWNLSMYQQQWKEGIARLKDYDKSCLVVAVDDPRCRKFIEWWLLYKVEDKVYIRNSIIVDEIYDERIGHESFINKTCYNFIPDRAGTYDEDGNKISEWIIDEKI